MNDFVMQLFSDETQQGTFRVMKGTDLAEGYEWISARVAQTYPIFAWSPDKIRT
ncbi:hypothetical protein SEPCBS57363_006837, partial [Sporothrix epigloea]